MRRLVIVLSAVSLLSAAVGCHHTCNCNGDGGIETAGGHETLAGVVTGRNWQPAFVNPAAPLAGSATTEVTTESEPLPQPRRMPTGAPSVIDIQPAQ